MRRIIGRVYQAVLDHRVPITGLAVSGYLAIYSLSEIYPHSLADPEDPLGMVGGGVVLAGVGLRSWAAGGLSKGRVLATGGP